jgi:hypothetical protein
MTQEQFYKQYPVMPDSKEQRLVLDLRDADFSWNQISLIFLSLTLTPYDADWNVKLLEETAQ